MSILSVKNWAHTHRRVFEFTKHHARLFEEVACDDIHGVGAAVDHLPDSRVDDRFGAVRTGTERAIKSPPTNGNSMGGGLDNGVFLGMNTKAFI